jgi:hypothetical protein
VPGGFLFIFEKWTGGCLACAKQKTSAGQNLIVGLVDADNRINDINNAALFT